MGYIYCSKVKLFLEMITAYMKNAVKHDSIIAGKNTELNKAKNG